MKGNAEELIPRLDTETDGYYEYLLHSYPEGRTDTFYMEITQFQFSILKDTLAVYWPERSEHCSNPQTLPLLKFIH